MLFLPRIPEHRSPSGIVRQLGAVPAHVVRSEGATLQAFAVIQIPKQATQRAFVRRVQSAVTPPQDEGID